MKTKKLLGRLMMKKILLLVAASLLFFSCLGKEESDDSESSVQVEESIKIPLYSLYPTNITSRVLAGKDQEASYSIAPGSIVYATGNSEQVGNFEWLEIENEDGKTAWLWAIYLAPDGSQAIMTDDMILYDKPDDLSVSKDFIQKFQMVSAEEAENGFYQIRWVDKSISGITLEKYIKRDNISFKRDSEDDFTVVQFLDKLKSGTLEDVQIQALLESAKKYRNSAFYQDLLEFEASLKEPAELVVQYSLNDVTIVNTEGVNLRSAPESDSEIITLLSKDQVATIIGVEEKQQKVGNFGPDYWYKISGMVDDEIFEGWIFGTFLTRK